MKSFLFMTIEYYDADRRDLFYQGASCVVICPVWQVFIQMDLFDKCFFCHMGF